MTTKQNTTLTALSILCQGFVVVQERGLDKAEVFTRAWWSKPFQGETLAEFELGSIPKPVSNLLDWIQARRQVPEEELSALVIAANSALKEILE